MKEGQHTEWKASWRDDYLRWLCGFATAEGGVLVIGRNDRGHVVGIPDAAELLETLPNKIRDLLGIVVEVNLREKNGKEYLEVVTPAFPSPISYRGHYYQRSGSTLQELKGAALDRFLLRRQGRTWDGVPIPNVTPRMLSNASVAAFRAQARNSGRVNAAALRESTATLMERLHLSEGAYLKRAAVLAFHPDPERFVTGAFVKIGFFHTDDELRYHDEIHGPVITQVDQILDVLQLKYLKAAITYKGIRRVETYPVPEPALREAVLNAIIHKDYATGAPVQISVYADRLMVWNPGQLPPSWTVEKLKRKHASHPFNPDLATAFFRAGAIEAWGRGIERMMAACRTAGVPEPVLEHEETGLWVNFRFSNDYRNLIEGTGRNPAKRATTEVTGASPPV
ncbi:MAG: putative DNA binding domain-containing protein [Candidatus Wallbacteria bacterium]|nr:putative DNA binding domain-containing protein [Candidatus Wallbacteria bacterium]